MKRTLTTTALALALLLAACAGKKTTSTGPKLTARISCNVDEFNVPDEEGENSKGCDIDSESNDYEITIEIDTDDGTQKDDPAPNSNEPTFPAQALAVTVTVNGAPVSPAPNFTPQPGFESSTNTSDKITLPAANKGQNVVIHAQTQDSRGLKSNPIDLTFTLN